MAIGGAQPAQAFGAQASGELRAAQGGSATGAQTVTLALASAVPASDLQRWFDGAAAGHRAVYASGLVLLQHADGVRLARRLANGERARLSEERDADNPRLRRWYIEKVQPAS